jgi:hypothetical protein
VLAESGNKLAEELSIKMLILYEGRAIRKCIKLFNRASRAGRVAVAERILAGMYLILHRPRISQTLSLEARVPSSVSSAGSGVQVEQ